MENACRDCREEAGLEQKHLTCSGTAVLADATRSCHHYAAVWMQELAEKGPTKWTPPAEDPNDNDLIRECSLDDCGVVVRLLALVAYTKDFVAARIGSGRSNAHLPWMDG